MDTAESVFDSLHSTIMYYSTWRHLKELILVPYQKPSRTNLKSTVFKSKAGTTTILISSMDGTKTKKTSETVSQTKSSGRGETGKTSTGSSSTTNPTKSATQKSHKSDQTKTNSPPTASTKSTTKRKSPIIEEVSHAREVEEYLVNEVYFGQSKTPRDYRTKYSVGQIVKHKTSEFVGVIIGWDKVAQVCLEMCVYVPEYENVCVSENVCECVCSLTLASSLVPSLSHGKAWE